MKRLLPKIALVLAVGLAVWQAFTYAGQRHENTIKDEAVKVASAQVIDLTTLDPQTVGSRLKAMKKRTSGDFEEQLSTITSAFTAAVTRGNVTAKGSIDKAALTSSTKTTADVLVASTATVTNGHKKRPVKRAYRIRVDLKWSHGRWLVNGMEFVS